MNCAKEDLLIFFGWLLRQIDFPLLLDSTFESLLLNYKVVVQSFRLKLNLLFAFSFCRFSERQKKLGVTFDEGENFLFLKLIKVYFAFSS